MTTVVMRDLTEWAGFNSNVRTLRWYCAVEEIALLNCTLKMLTSVRWLKNITGTFFQNMCECSKSDICIISSHCYQKHVTSAVSTKIKSRTAQSRKNDNQCITTLLKILGELPWGHHVYCCVCFPGDRTVPVSIATKHQTIQKVHKIQLIYHTHDPSTNSM